MSEYCVARSPDPDASAQAIRKPLARMLITPLILAAMGCAATGEDANPTAFQQPTVVMMTPQPEPVLSESRELVPGKATKTTRRRTVKPNTVDAVTMFPFEDNRIYPIAVSPGYFTSIVLEPGETMPGKAALGDPDPANWIVEKTQGGSKAGQVVVLLVKPGRSGISTNMFIPTSRRTYQLDVTAYSKRAMDQVRWSYPEQAASQLVAAAPACIGSYGVAFDPSTFDRNYSVALVSGDKPRWLPRGAFSIGDKSYIEFPAGLGQISAPAVFLVDSSGMASPAPFRTKGRYFEIDRQFSLAELRQGETVVHVSRNSS